ncbi:MAG: tetratricopeptide repeat protein [Bryobacteraceae bacterium]
MPEPRLKTPVKPKARARAKAAAASPERGTAWWMYPAIAIAALYVVFQVYSPALGGPFVFDDNDLPYRLSSFSSDLRSWISGVRPLLMFTYWLNFQVSKEPFGYHAVNVFLHVLNGFLLYFIIRKLLVLQPGETPARNDGLIAGFAASAFLLHPVQTEAVSYIASRSECLSVLFFFAAFAAFLYRGSQAISWRAGIGVLALFAAALATKEHTLTLAGLLVLTDYYWNPGFSFAGIRRNWRIYLPVVAVSLGGLAFVGRILERASSAGFRIKEFTWYQFFFTQCRAFFVYLRLFLFPAGQNIDYDYPISRTLVDRGAILGLIAILVLAVAAFYFRRRYPLASYGFFVYLLLMAPTSSFVPIKDALAERRMYLPMIGLLLIMADGLRRVRLDRRKMAYGMSALAAVLAFVTWQRNQVWAADMALWEDSVHKSPQNPRAHFQLAQAYMDNGRVQDALSQFAETARLQAPTYELLVDWGLAYDQAGRLEEALAKLRQAAALRPGAHVYSQIGMVYAKRSQWPEALAALDQAEKLDPNYAYSYYYRGGIRAKTGDFAGAVADYQRALAIDPSIEPARQGLAYAQQRLATPR